MPRILLRLGIGIVAFAIGVGASQFFVRKQIRCVSTTESGDRVSARPVPQAQPKYEVRVMGHQAAKGGYSRALTGFVSADGPGYSLQSIYYDSPERANHELSLALRKAKTIRSEQVQAGSQTLSITIATFGARSDFGRAAVLWTDGSVFRFVQSSSLENILEFEKDFKPNRCLPLCEDLARVSE